MKASDYKKLASQKQTSEDLTLPSGAVFTLRTAPLKQWVAVGILPASLTAKMQEIVKFGKDEAAANKYVAEHFTEQDFTNQQNLGRRLLEYCAVEPKVKIDASPDDDAIAPEDIMPEDFEAIMKWIWSGGRQGETLAKFRDVSA